MNLDPISEKGMGFCFFQLPWRNDMEKYFEIFGLKPGASEKEILEAYKVLVKVWNPERFSDDPNIQRIATEKIKEIDDAFKQLLVWADGRHEKGKEIPEPPSVIRGSIVVQTEPAGAMVYINEKHVGTTPYEGKDLPIDTYRVRVTKEGYEIWEQNVDMHAGAEEEVFAKLKLKEPESGQLWKDPYTEMEFIHVKGGWFEMGDTFGDGESDEQPVHKVFLDDFYIGKYLVTQGVWQKIIDSLPYSKTNYYDPVVSVSWNDVQRFIGELNQKTRKIFRLPTEAEWEYAAGSGGKKEKWAGTSNISELAEYAWYASNSGMEFHPVGEKRPNGLGLHDMSGNVCEWVQDLYDKYHDPKGDLWASGKERVYRGGSWYSEESDVRVSKRFKGQPEGRGTDLGFRLAFSAEHKKLFTTEKEQPITSEDKTHSTSQLSSHIAKYAGFWKRFAAFIIDSILMTIVTYVIYLIFIIPAALSAGKSEDGTLLRWIMGIIVNWLYWAVMESSSKQATLGKMALGIVVIDYKGQRISFGRATGRQFARIISALILLIGYIMAGFTEKKQALHDMIAETLVVVKK
jgi:formylglycine-generating enzyme required for sulfatase activity/uncharacterized RDD family membrane protein YckC